MLRWFTIKIAAGIVGMVGMACAAFAQQAAPPPAAAPLAFKVDWVRPVNQEDTKVRYMPVQQNVGDPNVEMKFYGATAKQILTTGTPGSATTPYGVWTGTAEGPFAVTFKLKSNSLNLAGNANIRWFTKTSGFHVVRPVVKLTDGTLLVGDLTFASVPKLTMSEFSLANVRWIKLNPDKVVTVNSGPAAANPNNEIWAPNVDLTKVEEVGFADLMPGSGHGTGGYIQLGTIEVYGRTAPLAAGK